MKATLAPLLLVYFRALAHLQLKKYRPKIIGITGSAGKTSAMTACEAVLKAKYAVKTSHKANSESGIPLDILGLQAKDYSLFDWLRLTLMAPVKLLTNKLKPDIYLVEMGIDSPFPPKNMSYLLTIILPDVGIFLNANLTHAATFDALLKNKQLASNERRLALTRLIALEKGKIISKLPQSAIGILNTDDVNAAEIAHLAQATLMTYGAKGSPNLKITGVEYGKLNTKFLFKYQAKTYQLNLKNMLLPTHFGYSFAAAICCGLTQDIGIGQAIRNIEDHYTLSPGRSSVIAGINGATILDSSYNASAAPTIDMLELLSKIPGKRKLALLGDLRELGESSEAEHIKVAKKAGQVCDQVNLVGPMMMEYALPVLEKAGIKVTCHNSSRQAADVLKDQLQPGDLLLVKGSQNTLLLEIAVERLMTHPEDADRLLCRRGKYWDKQRRKLMF